MFSAFVISNDLESLLKSNNDLQNLLKNRNSAIEVHTEVVTKREYDEMLVFEKQEKTMNTISDDCLLIKILFINRYSIVFMFIFCLFCLFSLSSLNFSLTLHLSSFLRRRISVFLCLRNSDPRIPMTSCV